MMVNDPFFRMQVKDVFQIRGRGTVAVGRINQGTLSAGDEVDIQRAGSTKRAVVTALEMLHQMLKQAGAGDNVGVLLKDVGQGEVQRGDMLLGVGGAISPGSHDPAVHLILSRGGRKNSSLIEKQRDSHSMSKNVRKWLVRTVVVVILALLLWWAFRKAPLGEIWAAIRQLRGWQIAVILTLNGIFYVVATLRWWVIIRADNKQIPYFPLLGVRVSVFGVSYFTLGPQVGGEPLQVLALQKRYGLTYTHATATVLMDKLLEFLVDFFMLAIGLTAILRVGVLAESGLQFSGDLLLLAFLILWPPIHIILLYNRHYPLSGLVRRIPFIRKNSKPVRFICAAERLAGRFCQRHPTRLLTAIGFSLLAGAGMLIDYTLMTAFLNIPLTFWKMTAGWMMGWISLVMPLPGGLGALEASQVFTLGRFGFSAAAALSLTLFMRGRDMLIGGLGLLLAGTGWNRKAKPRSENHSKK